MGIVEVSNVTKKYSKVIILNNISLTVNEGEIIGLIGPSGSGKTTLVKSIMGMEKIENGEIYVLGEQIPNIKILNSMGYMAQSDALYEELTGRENIEFFAKLFRLSKKEIKNRVEYTSKLVNLEDDLSKRVSNYSGGMKRRLSLAIALVQDPKLLILDEPTVGIDPKLRFSIWKELKTLKEQGKTIIITTHVIDEAEKCDKLVLIRDGVIIATGSVDELKKKFKVNTVEEIFIL
ncbi:ABC-2 type transport system ATP-binding protein [Clostridium cavendishii DSM 21758]|uniref:ABC-2 type transport system ATP-binding protein n=1 Tax=Clostridium cavendishii DSM 21758 TaxID=1121302 RepID=A0A1M6DIY1_9CLOT|nr:ABC transporter ATP-binding protein [Clostridium cavendishii]SHI73083.1 ABC-2 type transport system ATP-binding protein [Clostridium cavendishii DSM 21758]